MASRSIAGAFPSAWWELACGEQSLEDSWRGGVGEPETHSHVLLVWRA